MHHLHRNGQSDLPIYARSISGRSTQSLARRSPVEHSFSLFSARNQPWATLKVSSNAPSVRFLPSYFEGQSISGNINLDLCKPDAIQSVSVTLSGQIVATNVTPFTFLEEKQLLWSTDMGDPRSPTSSGQLKYSGKLQGAYRWVFSFTMPSTCSVSWKSKEPPIALPIPPSFSERGATQYINYELFVWIRRGPLRIDSKLGTSLGYSPRIRPDPPSMLRQLAYQNGSPIVGPEGDPKGWTVSQPIPIKGTLFGKRPVEATCTLSISVQLALALPLCYTRGTAIPCSMTISARDCQAVDLLATPKSPQVRLLRKVNYGAVEQPLGKDGQTLTHSTTDIVSAVWWPDGNEECTDVHTRRLNGEIHLPKDLQPSFIFGRFSVKYVIVFQPFEATAFEATDKVSLFSASVDIATSHAHGPLPRAYAPPGYDHLLPKPTSYGMFTSASICG
ncbi:hypothetical protein BD410DRAFT_604749 [Rickenella mellea]|uniref:Arrestin-like N-terminal domain-containing protein n=1 Tax=Rickenella mellea TaxID=50990 RepID=A0A4Y7QDD8_9AGAM|nr:hypothetical protein BD410DRAFT_604749 [Rickenella mellea]